MSSSPTEGVTEGAPASRVDVFFRDRDGVRWWVHEFGIIAGEAVPYPIGTVAGLYRGFIRVDNRADRRAVLLATKAQYEPARVLSVHELQRELDRSTPR